MHRRRAPCPSAEEARVQSPPCSPAFQPYWPMLLCTSQAFIAWGKRLRHCSEATLQRCRCTQLVKPITCPHQEASAPAHCPASCGTWHKSVSKRANTRTRTQSVGVPPTWSQAPTRGTPVRASPPPFSTSHTSISISHKAIGRANSTLAPINNPPGKVPHASLIRTPRRLTLAACKSHKPTGSHPQLTDSGYHSLRESISPFTPRT